MLPWLYIHFPCLQLDGLTHAAFEADSSEIDKAIAIIDIKQNKVCQLNHTAADEGIRPGMGLATAVSLCAQLNIIEYKAELEQSRLNELAQWLYQAVADIALFEPNGLALKVTNMLALYGSLDNYLTQISTILDKQQVTYHAALGPTVLAAKLLACHTMDPIDNNEQSAQARLGQLAVDKLELPAQHIEQMHRVGIHQLQQLRQINSKELGRRFGLEVLNYLSYLDGARTLPLNDYTPPEYYSKSLELFHEIEQSQVLLFPLKRMINEMSDFLQKRELVVTSVLITLHHRNKTLDDGRTIEVASAGGEYLADKWMALVALRIERTELSAPVLGITLKTSVPVEKNCTTDNLFCDGQAQMTPQQLVSLLQAKVGKQHIVGIELQADHRPEFAFNYSEPLQPAKTEIPVDSDLPSLRPLVLLPEPQPLTQKYTILHGPERIRSAWWSTNPIYRDYFVARDAQGAVCWLYNEPCGSWYLQGYFC